ncbi:MAG: DUF4292 domain-containing protein, partial [Bacteroidetes bacterium]
MIQSISLRVLSLGLGTLLLVGSACKTKQVVIEEETAAVLSGPELLQTVARKQFQANTFDATARISIDSEAMKGSATATIRMEKDKAIWMSVRKFGFEVARALITPDSIFVLNRIGNEYVAEPLSYVSETFDLPADLSILQQLLLGNPVYLTTANPKVLLMEDTYLLSAEQGGSSNTFRFALPDYQLQEMTYQQAKDARSLKVNLLNYQAAGSNRDFAYLREIQINSSTTGAARLELTFNRVEINQAVNLKFEIPPSY